MATIEDIANSKTKLTEESTGILSLLFRRLLMRGIGTRPPEEITRDDLDRMFRSYLADPRNGAIGDNKRRSSVRGNLAKEIARDGMTWFVFLKGIRWLRPVRATFSVKLDFPGGSRIASVAVLLQDIRPEDEPESVGADQDTDHEGS